MQITSCGVPQEVLFYTFLAVRLLDLFKEIKPPIFMERFKLTEDELELESYDLLGVIAKRRGMLISRGEPDTERAAIMLLDEFRGAKLGKISLESPKEL